MFAIRVNKANRKVLKTWFWKMQCGIVEGNKTTTEKYIEAKQSSTELTTIYAFCKNRMKNMFAKTF